MSEPTITLHVGTHCGVDSPIMRKGISIYFSLQQNFLYEKNYRRIEVYKKKIKNKLWISNEYIPQFW